MRRGHRMRDPIGNCHVAHLDGDVPGFGAVIYFGQDVAVDIEHVASLDSRPENRMKFVPTGRRLGAKNCWASYLPLALQLVTDKTPEVISLGRTVPFWESNVNKL